LELLAGNQISLAGWDLSGRQCDGARSGPLTSEE
jgi:hypothetical protein